MGFSWVDLRDAVEDTALDFKNQATKLTGMGNNSDDIEEAIADLTTASYSPIYNNYKSVSRDALFEQFDLTDFIPSANISTTGTTEYGSWDPRLSRIDAFLSTGKSVNDSPVIVPFSSASAAGAFFDLTFHVESIVAKHLIENDLKNERDNIETSFT